MEFDAILRSLVQIFLMPPGSLLLLMLLGLFSVQRLGGRALLWVAFVGLYLLSLPVTLFWLAGRIETIPAVLPEAMIEKEAQAILVLMGDQSRYNTEYGGADALSDLSLTRMNYALYLHRQTGLPLILSGGVPDESTVSLAELGKRWLRQQADIEPLALETDSLNTWENLQFSAALLQRLGLRRVVLVTHAYHMKRASYSAQANGIDVIPAPFDFNHRSPEFAREMEMGDWLPNAWALAYNQRFLHEVVGQFWYRWFEG